MKAAVEYTLGCDITEQEYEELKVEWKAFAENPAEYADTIAVKMVRRWLEEKRDLDAGMIDYRRKMEIFWEYQMARVCWIAAQHGLDLDITTEDAYEMFGCEERNYTDEEIWGMIAEWTESK